MLSTINNKRPTSRHILMNFITPKIKENSKGFYGDREKKSLSKGTKFV